MGPRLARGQPLRQGLRSQVNQPRRPLPAENPHRAEGPWPAREQPRDPRAWKPERREPQISVPVSVAHEINEVLKTSKRLGPLVMAQVIALGALVLLGYAFFKGNDDKRFDAMDSKIDGLSRRIDEVLLRPR